MSRHPLQRLPAPSRGTSALVHLAGIISFTLSYKYLVDYPSMINDSYGWHMQYLTVLGLTVAYATFIFGFLADITLSPALFYVKNVLAIVSAPIEVVISLLYWGISAIDKSLVVPPEIHLSTSADIGFHAIPAVLLAIDVLFLSPPWTVTVIPTMGLSSLLAVSYWAWIDKCYTHNGFYPYPLFAQLDTTQRAVLFATSALIMTVSTVSLKWLYGRVNGLEKFPTPNKATNVKSQ